MVREADEFSDDGMSVSSQQARRMEQLEELEKLRLARQSAREQSSVVPWQLHQVDDPLAGADVVDEMAIMDERVQNELLADGPLVGATPNSRQPQQDEPMPEEQEGEERMAEDCEIIHQEEEDEETYSPMASKSRLPSTSGAKTGPRKSLFCAPNDPMRKFKFQMHNAPSDGPLDFGGGMDLSLLSSASSSAAADVSCGRMSMGGIAAEYATPVMGTAQAVRANSAERRHMAKPYIQIQQQQQSGIGKSAEIPEDPRKQQRLKAARIVKAWASSGRGGSGRGRLGEGGGRVVGREGARGSRRLGERGNGQGGGRVVGRGEGGGGRLDEGGIPSSTIPPRPSRQNSRARPNVVPRGGDRVENEQNRPPAGILTHSRHRRQSSVPPIGPRTPPGPAPNDDGNGAAVQVKEISLGGGGRIPRRRRHFADDPTDSAIASAIVAEKRKKTNSADEEEERDEEDEREREEGQNEEEHDGDGRGGRHTNSSGSLDQEEEANFWQQQEAMENNAENVGEQDEIAVVANEPIITKNPTNLDRDRWMYYDKCFPQRAHMANHDQTTIWVTGLDHNADTGLLYERFSQAGPVKRIALYREPTIFAHIEFGNRFAAKHAIRVNGNRIWHGMSLKCGWNAVVETFYAENGPVGNNQEMMPQPSLYHPPPMDNRPPETNFHPATRNKSASTQLRNTIEPCPYYQPSKKYQESNSYTRPPYVPPPKQNGPFNSLDRANSLAVNEDGKRSGYFFNATTNSEERCPLQRVQQNQSVRYERNQIRPHHQGRSMSRKNRYEEKPQRRYQRSPSPTEFDAYSTRSRRSRWDREQQNRRRFRSSGEILRNESSRQSPSPPPPPDRRHQQRLSNRRSDYRHFDAYDEHEENRRHHQYGGEFRRGEMGGNSTYSGGGGGMEQAGNRERGDGTFGGGGAECDKIRFF